MRFIGKYLVRTGHGSSFRLRTIPASKDLPSCDRLFLAMLKGDPGEAAQIIENVPANQWLEQLRGFCGGEMLSGLIYDRIHELGLAERLVAKLGTDGSALLSEMRQTVVSVSKRYDQSNQLFLQLLEALKSIQPPVLVVKGVVLSRTLYADPHHRLSVDFDLIVHERAIELVIQRLGEAGFQPIWNHPGHCHQLGVGPVGSVTALSIRPSADLEPWHNVCLYKDDSPYVELKSAPFESGLKMVEYERLWADAVALRWQEHEFFAPDDVDHLLLELVHLRKHSFYGWAWIYDIHLLVLQMNQTPERWSEFVRRCRVEGVGYSAWAALDLVADRLGTAVPSEVMTSLQPAGTTLSRLCLFSVESAFLWNLLSLPALFLSALFGGDGWRKWRVLKDCLVPSEDFLCRYYLGGRNDGAWFYPFMLIWHWLVLMLPSSITRRTIGRFAWKDGAQS